MKRIGGFVLVALTAVLMAGCSSEPDKTSPAGKAATEQLDSNAETVYITKTGSKYHRSDCGYLKKSKIAIVKSKAISRGFDGCSRCKP